MTDPAAAEPADSDPFAHVHDPFVRDLLARALGDTPASPPNVGSPYPWFEDAARGVRLYEGDAFDLLARARPESFDLIFADPPYFLSGGGITCQSGRMVLVDKGAWDKPTTFEEMHGFNREWLALCRRALKPDGSLWVSGTLHNIFSVGYALQTLGFKILNDIAWYKVNPPPNLACRYFTHATETVLWARKSPSARHVFHYADMKAENGGKQMQSLWSIKPPAPWEKRHGKHPTQKPEALLERIVRASSRPGDWVLDPFCGGGTTGVACVRLGRRFVGIDREADYLRLARLRIEDEQGSFQLVFAFAAPAAAVPAPEPTAPQPWADVVTAALAELGGEADLRQITRTVEGNPRVRTCPTWPATVRRVVRQSRRFEPLGRGRYRLRQGVAS
jgi:site-specific DNA-methyltransferase (adenine-specific)